ncbi:hypothetical protein LSH36_582g03048, partial [Paralvinella palmiformis]
PVLSIVRAIVGARLCRNGPESSDSDESFEGWVFYRDRPEWKDVEAIPQDEGPFPVVQIAYSDRFRDVYDYFRAIVQKDERSERALELTADAVKLNSANYTVWHFRRLCLKALNKDLWPELDMISKMIESHPKNYQVWHHRMVVVEWLNDASRELDFTQKILKMDAKNYHAWQHRQWVLKKFDLWENEIDYVNKLLNEDLRNNSAWNQRYFVINSTTKFTPEVMEREIRFTQVMINKAPNNESPWNYLRGLLLTTDSLMYPGVLDFCKKLYSENIRSPHLLAFMVDCYDELVSSGCDNKDSLLTEALQLLGVVFDVDRAAS